MARDISLADIRRATTTTTTTTTTTSTTTTDEVQQQTDTAGSNTGIGTDTDTTALLQAFGESLPDALDLDPDDPEQGLATLVLSLVELLRELLERQAIRRMEHGNLSDDDIDRLGDAFFRLKEKTDELKAVFGVSDEDLKLGFIEENL